ncbi:Microsomal_signal peptidase 18 kDa subunit [Hexamita inflata]|uniref:Signal peptidase complex catalytic subunit SEC11 n=1 Tax=Hexamita inflata TaxID=28002 RepID=A0ABP1IKS4_9EUKA
MAKQILKKKVQKLSFPIYRYVSTIKSLTLPDLAYMFLLIVQSQCQSVIYWNFCKFYLKNDIPITVVLTGSMEPGFQRGDIIPVQTWNNSQIEVGDVVVYQQSKRPVPIVHRVLDRRQIIWSESNNNNSNLNQSSNIKLNYSNKNDEQRIQNIYITKGDANEIHDWWLYDYDGRRFLLNENIMGVMWGNAPGIGFLTIALKESRAFQAFFYGLIILSGLIGYAEG